MQVSHKGSKGPINPLQEKKRQKIVKTQAYSIFCLLFCQSWHSDIKAFSVCPNLPPLLSLSWPSLLPNSECFIYTLNFAHFIQH